jgi:DNA helicase II / ATP-dependent DNA helicase PcrA
VDPLDGLNPEQRRAAEAVRGPVCILAGAGSGKTTTITRRIAQQVAAGAFAPSQIMAVTFTDKAAGELKARLAALGVHGVRASTFHSAALRQLRHFAPEAVGRILPTKALSLRQIANSLPAPFKFRPAGDLATEIEWAKNRRIPPESYDGRDPPIPIDLMQRVYREYESRKQAEGLVDFEDLLELAVRLFETNDEARETFRAQYRAFTVDEVQDVNLLQQSLLDLWLGERDDLCCVGDDYQSIYGFTGASPDYLLAMPSRFPHATVVRLEANYRSTPQVLGLANKLVPNLGGAEKTLRATLADGPAPVIVPHASPAHECAAIVEEIRRLGEPFEEIAILARTNARLADFEEVLHDAGIPFQGASLLARDAARRLTRRLERSTAPAAEAVRGAALESGLLERLPDKLGEREQVRQQDLARLVQLASVFDGDAASFVADLRRRFDAGGDAARGVNLLTLHRAKGLEFEAVFIPRLQEKELPSKQARTDDELAEAALRRHDAREAGALADMEREAFAVSRRAGGDADGAEGEAGLDAGRATTARLASRALEGRQRPSVCRVPRQRPARNRGCASQLAGRAGADRRHRPGKARALRRRPPGDTRRALNARRRAPVDELFA